ncbi:sugar phosphate isomerase/epimerase [Novosphingobium sp. EMRT-2]|uniref:sugar phosphate isomerase/epimerase n=1 Tax=Novosphingobium sp. EMRT-2 TaxID=2571749 RepID=UPI0010BD227B|nr:sugar phosphate isomerase/epimerase [Novosphingobium sp. EMRT-2]QCI95833.1 sugar phosphate isomerase/epimerase [Novosphingobium sp. EMRT-2]
MARLLVLQSVWGLDKCPGFDIENALDRALERVIDAGFDGVGVNIVRVARTAGVVRVMNPRGLAWEGQVLVHSADQLAAAIAEAHRLGAHHLNVQIAGPVAHLSDALALVDSLVPLAQSAPLPVWFETHRGRLTNDLLFTLRLLEARPDLPLTGDLSHYPVAGEMELPLRDDQLAAIERILRNCRNFHGRISTTHQVQVTFDAPQHHAWRDQHCAWWRRGFELWLEQAGSDEALPFMCELGPPPYAITAPDGSELGNRWDEAQRMKDMVRTLWREVNGTS